MPITTDPTTAIGQVRIYLRDLIEGQGILPQGGNLTDDEIALLLTREGDNVMRAVAAGASVVAVGWANAVNTTAGPLKQELQQAYEHWASLAKSFLAQYGSAQTDIDAATFGAFSVAATRDDGYSTDCGAEYGPCRRRWRPC